ncbi:MAG: DUF2178 domain-containing protein [Bacillota bacterium]|jgi:uncharacterized membrane protein
MKDYRKTNMIWFIVCALVGAVFVAGGVYLHNEGLIGFGVAFAVVVLLRMIMLIWRTRDEESKYEYNMSASDERTVYLAHKARSIAFYISVLAEAVLLIVMFILENPIYQWLAYLLCAQCLLYAGCYYYLRAKN